MRRSSAIFFSPKDCASMVPCICCLVEGIGICACWEAFLSQKRARWNKDDVLCDAYAANDVASRRWFPGTDADLVLESYLYLRQYCLGRRISHEGCYWQARTVRMAAEVQLAFPSLHFTSLHTRSTHNAGHAHQPHLTFTPASNVCKYTRDIPIMPI
jgi:hypothetical protein